MCDPQTEARSPWRRGGRRGGHIGVGRAGCSRRIRAGRSSRSSLLRCVHGARRPPPDDARVSCRSRRPRSTLNIRPVPGEGPGPATGGAANASAPSGRSRLPRVGLERDRDPSRSSSAVQSASRPRLGARRGRDADSSFVGHFVRVSRRGLTRLPYPRAGRRFLSRRARRAR